MSHAFRPIGVYQGHSHTFEVKSGQNEEGLDLGSSLEEGVLGKGIDLDWKMAPRMGQAQSAEVGELVIAAEQQLGTLHFLECCCLQYSCGWLLRVQNIISWTTESTLHPPTCLSM